MCMAVLRKLFCCGGETQVHVAPLGDRENPTSSTTLLELFRAAVQAQNCAKTPEEYQAQAREIKRIILHPDFNTKVYEPLWQSRLMTPIEFGVLYPYVMRGVK